MYTVQVNMPNFVCFVINVFWREGVNNWRTRVDAFFGQEENPRTKIAIAIAIAIAMDGS
jgi:hypothetical protein